MMLVSRFKKFDAYIKTAEGVNQQTVLGAIITIISSVAVLVLLWSEISLYLKTDVVSRLSTDSASGVESVRLKFSIEFSAVPCSAVEFMQEVTRGTLHVHEPGDMRKFDANEGSGCTVVGSVITDKAGGNFRFKLNGGDNQPAAEKPVDISHKINYITFNHVSLTDDEEKLTLQRFPELVSPFNSLVTSTPAEAGAYHYSVQVIPTHYRTQSGREFATSQYAYSERLTTREQLQKSPVVGGIVLKEFLGVVFTYDFHPVMVTMEERREKLIDFVSNLFGIVGGVITVLSLVEGFLHQSTKVLLGKKD